MNNGILPLYGAQAGDVEHVLRAVEGEGGGHGGEVGHRPAGAIPHEEAAVGGDDVAGAGELEVGHVEALGRSCRGRWLDTLRPNKRPFAMNEKKQQQHQHVAFCKSRER